MNDSYVAVPRERDRRPRCLLLRRAATLGAPADVLVDALQVALETAGNRVMAERIGQMKLSAERGDTLAKAARATGVFTPTILQMVAVGEETGALGEMMNEVADFYQKDVEHAVRGLAAQIEPIMIVLMGCMVLVVALGVFLPMWDLSRVVIHHH